MLILHETFQELKTEVNTCQLFLWGCNYPDIKITHKYQKKVQQKTNVLYRCKIHQQYTNKRNLAIYKRIKHQDQVEFIPRILGWLNIWKSINTSE